MRRGRIVRRKMAQKIAAALFIEPAAITAQFKAGAETVKPRSSGPRSPSIAADASPIGGKDDWQDNARDGSRRLLKALQNAGIVH
jgi:hypothetical protein